MKGFYKYFIFIFINLFYVFQINIFSENTNVKVNLAQNSLQSASNSNWISTNNPIKISSTRFNWVKRNDTKKKVYYLYNNLIIILESLQNVLDLFRNKLKEVEKINLDFKNGLAKYANNFDKNYNDINQMSNKIFENISSLKKLEESELFKEKEFKKIVSKINDELENQNLIHKNNSDNVELINQSTNNLFGSINLLENQIKTIKSFENNAWTEYQKLDELISDDQAKTIYFKILNFSENAEQINTFVRGDFLNFFNKTMQNIASAINTVNDDIENWIKESNLIIKKVDDLVKQDINEKIKTKQKEDEIKNQKILEEKKKELEKLKKSIKPKTFTEQISENLSQIKNKTLNLLNKFFAKIKDTYLDIYKIIFNKQDLKNQIHIKNLYEKKESAKSSPESQKIKDPQLESNKINLNASDLISQTQNNLVNANVSMQSTLNQQSPAINTSQQINLQPSIQQPLVNTAQEIPLTIQPPIAINETQQNSSSINNNPSLPSTENATLLTSEIIPEAPLSEDKKADSEVQAKEQFKQTFPENTQAQQSGDKQENLLLSMNEASKVTAPTETSVSSIGTSGNKGFLDKTDLNMEKSGNIGERSERKKKKQKKSKKKKSTEEENGEENTEKVFNNKPVVRAKNNKKKPSKKNNAKNQPTRRPVIS
jgi:hypothetical protein